MGMWRRLSKALGGLMAFLGAGWLLLRLGRADWLSIDWSDPTGWMASVGTEAALGALARLAGLALLAWIGLSTAIYVVARLLGASSTSIDWLSIGPIRRAIDGLLAGSLLIGSIAPAGAAVDPPDSAPVATTAETAVEPAYIPVPAGPGEPEASDEVEPRGEKPSAPSAEATTVVVEPGDDLWKLAERRLAEFLRRAPTDAEIAPYWVAVIEANRERIRSDDPDLIFPGEQISLPRLSREN